MSATGPSSPFDQLGLDAPFVEGAEEEDRYESWPSLREFSESPFSEAPTSGADGLLTDLSDERLAWLDVEAADGNAQVSSAEEFVVDAETPHEREPSHEGEGELLPDDTTREFEAFDDEERDASESGQNYALQEVFEEEAEGTAHAAPLTARARAWVRAIDRSAIERLPDTASRARFLQQDWTDVEFPGNVPSGKPVTAEIKRHWALARSLFDAMAGVVPERRVPRTIRFRDRPVVMVPGQSAQRLFAEARDAFVRMRDAARVDGVDLVILSSWRTRARQAAARANQPNQAAMARGASAHMYGLAVDLRMGIPGLPVKELNTRVDRVTAAKAGTAAKMGNLVRMYRSPVYKWLSLRARDFGWYPYRNEPWHWEYNPPGLKARFEGGLRRQHEQPSAGEEAEGAQTWEQLHEGGSSSEGGDQAEGELRLPNLRTFTPAALDVKVAVYVTKAARTALQVEMLVFAHGLDLCRPVCTNRPATFITQRPFRLGELVERSGRPIVLVVPFLDWEHLAANRMAFGRRWHRLAQPVIFNQVIAEALEQVRALTGTAAPTLQRLILAGHSRAYGFFDALAHAHASPDMRTGALSKPTCVWALDTTYTAPIADWRAWLSSRQDLQATVVYRHGEFQAKSSAKVRELTTGVRGKEFAKLAAASNGRLKVMPVPAGQLSHCAVPSAYLPRLLAGLTASVTAGELESEALQGWNQPLGEDEDVASLTTEAEAIASNDMTTSSEWTEQADEEVSAPGRFDAFGDERDSEWGSESGEETQWQEGPQDEAEQAWSFALDGEEQEASLDGSGLTPAEKKAVEITSLFETGKRGGFYGLSGNFDGQGLSFGLVNWTIGTGSLQPLLRDFAKEHPDRWVRIFGADAARFLQLIARPGKDAQKEQHRFAIEQMNMVSIGPRGKRIWTVRQPWVNYFKRLAQDQEFRKIQVRYVRDLLASAEQYCRRFRLTSEQSFCFMFDTVATHGKSWLQKTFGGEEKRRLLIEQALKALAARHGADRVAESEVLLAIADVLATTSAQRWADRVRRRKRWFVIGQYPRLRELDGIKPRADVSYAISKKTAGERESLAADSAI